MYFAVVLDCSNLSYYGDIPDISEEQYEQIEFYHLSDKNVKLFLTIIDELDQFCGALLDYGDIDYFSGEKLLKLDKWISGKLPTLTDARLIELLTVLAQFANKALNLDTGVIIEL